MRRILFPLIICIMLVLAACGGDDATDNQAQVFQATLPPNVGNAPVFTVTPTVTPSLTPTITPTLTITPSPTPTETRTPTLTLTPTATFTPSPTLTPTPTLTLTPSPTQRLLTLTPVNNTGAPAAFVNPTAIITTPEGWSCGDFPCEDNIAGFMQRIRVPAGYGLEHVGRFPGQPMQITYGPDGRLYATVLENGTRSGAVYALDESTGEVERYSESLNLPIGLAFQPGTSDLYVSARLTPEAGGGLWRVRADGTQELVVDNLPCCYSIIDNQPNGLVFGPDGYLYLGVGSLSDHGEPANPERQRFAEINLWEASILRIQPHTAEVTVYAAGIRNPYDLTFDDDGQFYATDNGIVDGLGDRVLRVDEGGHYGWPYWRNRGCGECPPTDNAITYSPDLLPLPDYTLPRGIVAYTGNQFPANVQGSLFVAFWHNTPNAQRIVRIDPDSVPEDPEARAAYTPEPFVTGLIRPVDVIVAPDGTLVIADFIYGHIWRVRYLGPEAATTQETAIANEMRNATSTSEAGLTATIDAATLAAKATPASPNPQDAEAILSATASAQAEDTPATTSASTAAPSLFVTSTPRPG